MKTKILSLLLTVLLPGAATGFAQSGDFGENNALHWELDNSNRTLTISGTGAMPDYDFNHKAPWYSSGRYVIKTVIIENGVTNIGNEAFCEYGNLTAVTIGNGVTSIGDRAFFFTGLTSVDIPNSVTSIGDEAFFNCYKLTSINIQGSVTSIGASAFGMTAWFTNQPDGIIYIGTTLYCYKGAMPLNTHIEILEGTLNIVAGAFFGHTGLASVTVPGSVINIGESAFDSCSNLTSITIGNGVKSIGNWAFTDCNKLTSIAIPGSVTSIGSEVFLGCYGLTAIDVHEDNAVYASENGVLFNREKTTLLQYPKGKPGVTYTIPGSVTSIGNSAFYFCLNLTSVTIGNNVTSIGNWAFAGCDNLTSAAIGNNVTSIGDYAFAWCGRLASATIPDKVTSIGNYAFYFCLSLTSVTIGNSVTSIGEEAFAECRSLASVAIPESVTSIGDEAFAWCSGLTSVTIGNNVTSIGDRAFSYCGNLATINVSENNAAYTSENGVLFNREKTTLLRYPEGKPDVTYTIPGSVTNIEESAFDRCANLTSVAIGNNVTSIGDEAFRYCENLTSVTIPDNVTSIGGYAFTYCISLQSATIGNSVTSIGDLTFKDCFDLESVTIGSSVASIGAYAFAHCIALKSVINLRSTPQVIDSEVFLDVNISDATLSVPSESVNAYRDAPVWTDFNIVSYSAINMPENTNNIRVYPNPVRDELFIQSAQPVGNVTIYNLSGHTVGAGLKPAPTNPPAQNGVQSIDASHLPAGIYFVKAGNYTGKFVKE